MQKKTSKELYSKAIKLMPGGVNSPVRACRNVGCEPTFIESAKGAYLTSIDGQELLDFVLSWGAIILGHANPTVINAIKKAASFGTSFGAPCKAEIQLAKEIIDAFPGMDMIRMVSSGTEATMSALRLARGVTGRNKMLKFIGCYHGHADSFLASAGSGVATLSIPGTPGVPEVTVRDTLLAPYNDLTTVKDLFAMYGKDLAAVFVEPIAANMGLIPPKEGFLKGLRSLCDAHGTLLIMDEVITGFRVEYGGAQTRFDITPDLTTLGKIIGGGLPVGAYGGKAKYMEHIAPLGEIYQAGTLAGNPLVMTAGFETLQLLKDMDYTTLETQLTNFARELETILKGKGIPVQLSNFASMFTIFFTNNELKNFDDVKTTNTNLYGTFFRSMQKENIFLVPSPFETNMVSFAHKEKDFEKALTSAQKITLNLPEID